MPDQLAHWVDRVVAPCRRPTLGAVGLYLSGSACAGSFHPAVSDVDLILVVNSAVGTDQLAQLCADLVELGLPPAAGGLDLDVFTSRGLRHPDPDPGWQSWVRWSRGRGPAVQANALHVSDWAPALAVARDHAIAVFGRPPLEAFGPISRRLVLQAGREELAEWNDYQPFWSLAGGVLTACRVWWYWAEGNLGSKVDAGRWALDPAEGEERALIQGALEYQLRGTGPDLASPSVVAFVHRIADRVGERPG